ncbi:hypothetical protein, partial [Aeromonas caviae]|uniref:hypothetical protein n=1 Tax=Aeromonas caviae TaxID=648 RepID=UPI001325BA96
DGLCLCHEQTERPWSTYQKAPSVAIAQGRRKGRFNSRFGQQRPWYDNEWGYANRTAELMRMVGQMDKAQG